MLRSAESQPLENVRPKCEKGLRFVSGLMLMIWHSLLASMLQIAEREDLFHRKAQDPKIAADRAVIQTKVMLAPVAS